MIETTLGNFTETNIIVNTKAPKGLDSFHRLEVAKVPVYALDTDTKQTNKQTNITSSTETENFENKIGFL